MRQWASAILALGDEHPISDCDKQHPCGQASWRACSCTNLGQAKLGLREGTEAEVQLNQLGQVAQPAGQVSMPPRVAAHAFSHMPRCSMQTDGQASQSIHPAQAYEVQHRTAQGATEPEHWTAYGGEAMILAGGPLRVRRMSTVWCRHLSLACIDLP